MECKQCCFRHQPASVDMQNGSKIYMESKERKLCRVTEEGNEKCVCKCRRVGRNPLKNTYRQRLYQIYEVPLRSNHPK